MKNLKLMSIYCAQAWFGVCANASQVTTSGGAQATVEQNWQQAPGEYGQNGAQGIGGGANDPNGMPQTPQHVMQQGALPGPGVPTGNQQSIPNAAPATYGVAQQQAGATAGSVTQEYATPMEQSNSTLPAPQAGLVSQPGTAMGAVQTIPSAGGQIAQDAIAHVQNGGTSAEVTAAKEAAQDADARIQVLSNSVAVLHQKVDALMAREGAEGKGIESRAEGRGQRETMSPSGASGRNDEAREGYNGNQAETEITDQNHAQQQQRDATDGHDRRGEEPRSESHKEDRGASGQAKRGSEAEPVQDAIEASTQKELEKIKRDIKLIKEKIGMGTSSEGVTADKKEESGSEGQSKLLGIFGSSAEKEDKKESTGGEGDMPTGEDGSK